MSILLAALSAGTATAAEPAQQFDLVCTGSLQRSPEGPKEPWSERYRVDIAAGRWCIGACTDPRTIQSVSTDRITFYDDDGRAADGDRRWHYVSRVTGDLVDFTASPGVTSPLYGFFWSIEGKCEPAAFSGMPTPKF